MCHFALKTKVKEIFKHAQVMKMFEVDFHEANKDEQALFHDERKLMKKVKERIHHRNDGQKNYQGFMSEDIEKGYAPRVPSEELSLHNGCIWYIPHHRVYHRKKPGKIRVVF